MRRAAPLLALAGVLAGCGGGGGDPSEPGVVAVRDLRYRPATLTVDAGATVTWRFDDGNIPHDVKGDGFASPILRRREWSRTFDDPGTYDYLCSVHPYMRGKVVVR